MDNLQKRSDSSNGKPASDTAVGARTGRVSSSGLGRSSPTPSSADASPVTTTSPSKQSLQKKPIFVVTNKMLLPKTKNGPIGFKRTKSSHRSYLPVRMSSPKSLPSKTNSMPNAARDATYKESVHTLILESTESDNMTWDDEKEVAKDAKLDRLARLLASRKKDLDKMKQNLIPRQNIMIERYVAIKDLETKIIQCGLAVPEPEHELRVLDVGCWSGIDLRLLTREELGGQLDANESVLGGSVVRELSARLRAVPEDVLALCGILLAQQNALLNWLRLRSKNDKAASEPGRNKKLQEVAADTERLRGQVERAVAGLRVQLDQAVEMVKMSWKDREQLVKRLEKTRRELHAAQRKLEPAGELAPSKAAVQQAQLRDTTVEELREQLKREQGAREGLREMVASAEGTLRVVRARISDLERQLKEARAEAEAARRRHKELEQQSRHRETSFEARSKKLTEVSKTGEVTIDSLSKQRDALELRVKELSAQMAAEGDATAHLVAEERSRSASLESRLAEQQAARAHLEERLRVAESRVSKAERTWGEVRERCNRLLDMHQQKRPDLIPPQEGTPSGREVELWKELQVTRLALAQTEEKVRQIRRDKDDFLHQLSRIAHKEDKGSIKEKMAEELLEKERHITNLQENIDNLLANEKVQEQRINHYESQVSELRLEVMRLQNYDCNTMRMPFEDLHNELLELQMKVSVLGREREALVSTAASRSLMLERQERAAEMQRNAVRLREELVSMLEGRPPPPPPPPAAHSAHEHDKLAKSTSAVVAEAAQTWSALELERARVLKLERIVAAQQEQLERETCARTELERNRAQLERALAAADRLNAPKYSLY